MTMTDRNCYSETGRFEAKELNLKVPDLFVRRVNLGGVVAGLLRTDVDTLFVDAVAKDDQVKEMLSYLTRTMFELATELVLENDRVTGRDVDPVFWVFDLDSRRGITQAIRFDEVTGAMAASVEDLRKDEDPPTAV